MRVDAAASTFCVCKARSLIYPDLSLLVPSPANIRLHTKHKSEQKYANADDEFMRTKRQSENAMRSKNAPRGRGGNGASSRTAAAGCIDGSRQCGGDNRCRSLQRERRAERQMLDGSRVQVFMRIVDELRLNARRVV